MSTVSTAELDYIDVQEMNIIFLENHRNYTFTSQEIQYLLSIANKTHLYSANARSLYYLITGIKLYSDLPTQLGVNGRNVEKKLNMLVEEKVFTYPNPFNNYLSIESKLESNVPFEVISIEGDLVYSGEIKLGVNMINSSNWSTGMYLIKIAEEGKAPIVKRIIKTN